MICTRCGQSSLDDDFSCPVCDAAECALPALPWSLLWTTEDALVGADDATLDADDDARAMIDARLAADAAEQLRPRRTRTLLQRRCMAVGA